MRKCTRCSKKHSRNHAWCLKCHNKNMRNWRKTHPLTEVQRKKDRVRSLAGVYLRKGKIKKEKCNVCNSVNSEMHHPDYSRPLEIVWLCRIHHLNLHKELILA